MAATNPEVTILMPVYNGEKYLKEALDSILKQTFTNFEVLLINDGSTDNTKAIIENYDDVRIKVHHQENMGVARSLNKGISMIDTPYIRRHDADDISLPTMLEDQLNFLKAHQNIEMVSTMCAFMTDRSKVAHAYTQPKHKLFQGHDYILAKREQFNPYSPIVHGTVLGKTGIFKEMKGYRTAFLTSEDNDLWLRIIEKYNFAILNQCPYYLRLSETSATKMHKSTTGFYKALAYAYADERREKGTDPLLRGETMPKPKDSQIETFEKQGLGKTYRNDLLDFSYKVMLNAKDYYNAFKIMRLSLKDGWLLSKTWKGLVFPLLGNKFVERGVKLKKAIRS